MTQLGMKGRGATVKRAVQLQKLTTLKAGIDAGLADVAAGRVQDFDTARIVERGRKLSANRP